MIYDHNFLVLVICLQALQKPEFSGRVLAESYVIINDLGTFSDNSVLKHAKYPNFWRDICNQRHICSWRVLVFNVN